MYSNPENPKRESTSKSRPKSSKYRNNLNKEKTATDSDKQEQYWQQPPPPPRESEPG